MVPRLPFHSPLDEMLCCTTITGITRGVKEHAMLEVSYKVASRVASVIVERSIAQGWKVWRLGSDISMHDRTWLVDEVGVDELEMAWHQPLNPIRRHTLPVV